MGTLETVTAQLQRTSDMTALKTSLIDSDKLVVAGGSFSQVVTTIYNTSTGSFPGLDILRSAISISAMYDARNRSPVLQLFPNAYVDVKETILEWSTQVNQPAILCFTSGSKRDLSAIAHDIAKTLSSRGTLAGSFFFEKDKVQDDGDFFLTLAYQIAVNVPGMNNLVNRAVLRDPTILEKRGETQLTKLILEPLFCIPTPETPFTVLVDGFHKCKSYRKQNAILKLLARASLTFGDTLRFLFFAVSQSDTFDPVINRNDYYWVGRHIPLNHTTQPLHLSQLQDQFFHPCLSSTDTINKLWCPSFSVRLSPFVSDTPWDQAQRPHLSSNPPRDTSSMGALIHRPANVIGDSMVVPSGVLFFGSPMSVDLLSPHGSAGSPMVIDSLTSSPLYKGSPMSIDGIYMAHQRDDNADSASFYNGHLRLDSPATLAEVSRRAARASKGIENFRRNLPNYGLVVPQYVENTGTSVSLLFGTLPNLENRGYAYGM
ncbi:hypothetical protein D9619_004527 [Psilocybe cf. subviscida]|uniref:Nephrocystin 3-like N-terminal domain-containing protein n=1 Tax=Psilocybe cf. subviscida TaxID=2480587 RepID=A0A8H5BPR7_9AGAR|nr:hypothetical protein D9619_004527 [Psilocybe cf. subviscida]